MKASASVQQKKSVAQAAVDAGADAISVVNTIPGLVIDVQTRRPALGFGTGGVSGPGLRPVGVLATWKVRRALPSVPILGLGGVTCAEDALQYLLAGATLVGQNLGAGSPERAERVASQLSAGTVWVNCFFVRDLSAPFGGNGRSGIGREGGTWSFDFYCDVKNSVFAPQGWTTEEARV